MRLLIALAALSFASTCAASENPYAPLPADASAVDKLVRASLFGDPKAEPALETWLRANPSAPAAERAKAYHRLCNAYGVHSQTAPAIKACTDGLAVDPALAGNLAIVQALKAAEPLTATGSARVPLTWNPQGSQSADITVGGVTVPWIVDTGAEISVVTASNAKAMGVKMAKGDFTVGSTTADVQGGVGLIAEMKIGAATVRNVPVLVLPDKQLSIAGLPTIPAILGLPVMTAFKRLAWIDGGETLALGEAAPPVPADAPRLYWHEEGLGVALKTAAGEAGAHFDTGANRTDLAPPGVALLSAAERSHATSRRVRTGGAGGVVDHQEEHFPMVALTLAGVPIVLNDVAANSAGQGGAGRVGMDAVIQLESLVLDLEQMRVLAKPWIGPPRTPPKPAVAVN